MQFVKRLLMGVGAVALAAIVLSVAAPKVAHGMVAALVQVVNNVAVVNPTSSGTVQPVITTDTDSLSSRVPYQDTCTALTTVGTSIQCNLAAVPVGKRLVIEEVTAFCYSPTGKVTAATVFGIIGSSTIQHNLVLTLQESIVGSPGNSYAASELVRLYVDPGAAGGFTFQSGDASSRCNATVSGYLEPTNIQ